MTLFGISGILIGITSIALAIIVFIHNTRSPLNRVWSLFAISVAIWGFGGYILSIAQTVEDALFWWRVTHIGVIMIPVLFAHFIYIFLQIPKREIVYGIYAIGALFLIADTTPYFISEVQYIFNSFYYLASPGILYTSFVTFFIGTTIYTHYLMYRQYKLVSPLKQGQILYFFLATFIGYTGGITSFLPAFEIYLYPFLNFTVVLYPVIMAYAILKHRLFNIKVIATELLVVGISIATLIEIFFSGDQTEFILRTLLFLFVLGLGFLLIKSVIHEVEQREQLELLSQKLGLANEELTKLDRTKSEFISIASHQLRAPLTIIRGYVSMVLEGTLGKIDHQVQDALKKVAFSTNQLVKLINSLLNLSRIESGKIKYEFTTVNFQDLVRGVVEEFQPHAEKKGLALVFKNTAGNVPPFLLDADKIREVIVNVVDNAIKYSDSGIVHVQFDRVGSVQNDSIRVSIHDTGMGIKHEDIKKMFTKFARTQEAQTKDPNGLGIGLYFAKRVTDDHGGKVWVESKGLGKGSIFFVEIPLQRR